MIEDADRSVEVADPRPAGGLKQLVADTAREYGLTAADLMGFARTRDVVRARWAFMYRARQFRWPDGTPRYSLPQIGLALGGMNHTTVIHGLLQHARLHGLESAGVGGGTFRGGRVKWTARERAAGRAFVDEQIANIVEASRMP